MGNVFFCLGSKSPCELLPREVCLWWWWGKDGPTGSRWFVMFFGIQDVVNLPKGGLGWGQRKDTCALSTLNSGCCSLSFSFLFPSLWVEEPGCIWRLRWSMLDSQ